MPLRTYRKKMMESQHSKTRLTMSQALVRYLSVQSIQQADGSVASAFQGVWAIFGHGNVAGLGEALWTVKDVLPTYRGQNEQSMAHIAIAYAKQMKRRRMMAVTTSIGPGATNLLTASALAYVNRLPVLFLPGDVFASRFPEPVLQQSENFADGSTSVNDCFRPVSRYFDRITRPEQLLQALPRTMSVLTDPASCGPVTLSLCQDVQAESYDFPDSFFIPRTWSIRRIQGDPDELQAALKALKQAKRPLIVAGGGVRYALAHHLLADFSYTHGIPVAETQSGKSSLADAHPQNVGAIGVTGTSVANQLAKSADVVLALGTRLQDFTSGSNALLTGQVVMLNVQPHDAIKHQALSVVCDVAHGLMWLSEQLGTWKTSESWQAEKARLFEIWEKERERVVYDQKQDRLPADSEVIGTVNRACPDNTIVIGAAGSMPGELHKLWQAKNIDGYHMEYGFSCMGYEIAAGIGVCLADSLRPNVVFVGDGSYMMMNSELATAVMMGTRMTIIVTDNAGYGCIHRLQQGSGGAAFNNLYVDSYHQSLPNIDFVQHAQSLGVRAVKVAHLDQLAHEVEQRISVDGVDVIVLDTTPHVSTEAGGCWWEVAIPEVSNRQPVRQAYQKYQEALKHRNT